CGRNEEGRSSLNVKLERPAPISRQSSRKRAVALPQTGDVSPGQVFGSHDLQAMSRCGKRSRAPRACCLVTGTEARYLVRDVLVCASLQGIRGTRLSGRAEIGLCFAPINPEITKGTRRRRPNHFVSRTVIAC